MQEIKTLTGNYQIGVGAYVADSDGFRHIESRAEQGRADLWEVYTTQTDSDGATIDAGPFCCEFKGPGAESRAFEFAGGLESVTGWPVDSGGLY